GRGRRYKAPGRGFRHTAWPQGDGPGPGAFSWASGGLLRAGTSAAQEGAFSSETSMTPALLLASLLNTAASTPVRPPPQIGTLVRDRGQLDTGYFWREGQFCVDQDTGAAPHQAFISARCFDPDRRIWSLPALLRRPHLPEVAAGTRADARLGLVGITVSPNR